MFKNHRDYFLLLIITFFGAFLRFWYMIAPAGQAQAITPDEAVYGIQALQILDGHRPVFYAAQPYTGTLSAYLSALLFSVFGVSWFWLKLIPFLFSVAFVPLNFVLAWKVFRNRTLAYTTAFFSALGTPFWLNWASRAGSGYPEAAVIGNLILILTIGIVYPSSKPERSEGASRSSSKSSRLATLARTIIRFFILGILAGLGFWVQPTIAYYILPCALFIFWWRPRIIISLESLAATVGSAIGGFPVIWYNLKFGGLTSRSLFVGSWGTKAALYKLVTEGFPVLVGVRRPFSTQNFFTPLTILIFALYLAAFVLLVWKRGKKHFDEIPFPSFWGAKRLQNPGPGQARTKDSGQARMTEKCRTSVFSFKKTKPPDLFLAFLVSIVLIFSLSPPFNQFVIEPRYVFAFYSAIPLLVAFIVYEASKRAFLLSGAVILAFVVNAVMGIFWAPPLSFADPYQLDNVIKILRENKVYYINADDAAGHRIMFQTERGVTAAIRTGGMSEQRFPEYQQAVLDAYPSQRGYVFLKDSPLLEAMEEEIKHFSPRYERELVDDTFVVLVPQ